MANEEVGIRIALQGRRDAAAGVAEVEAGIEKIGTTSETAAKRTSRSLNVIKGGIRGVGTGLGVVGSFVKRGVLAVAAAGVAAIGTAIYKGFSRLQGIENATAKLTGLGHNAKAVSSIMDSALASVRGTAFGMDEAATTAAGAVAAGVKPGKDLERTLKLVADAATISGASMGDMGSIFNAVATSNKVQADTMNQLSDRGIPIVQLLAKELGVSTDAVLDLSKEGKIGFDVFRKAMDRGMGGAALKSGSTTTGALKNVGAALSRLGAGMVSGAFPMVRRVAKQAIVVIDGLSERLAPLMTRMNATLGPKMGQAIQGSGKRILKWIDRQAESVGNLIDAYRKGGGVSGMMKSLQGKIPQGNATALSSIGVSFGLIGDAVAGVDWDSVQTSFGSGVSDTVSVFAVVIGFAADNVDVLAKNLPMLIGAYAAFKVAQAAANIASLAAIPMQLIQIGTNISLAAANRSLATQMALTSGVQATSTTMTIRQTAATVIQSAATKTVAAAQKVLNVVMRANPIGLVITAALLLAAGFMLLYRKSDTFRGMIDGLWNNVLKPFGSFLGGAFLGYLKTLAKMWLSMGRFGVMAFRWLLTAAFKAFDGILGAAEAGLSWVPGMGKKIRSARAAFNEFGDSTIAKLKRVEDRLRATQTAIDGVARDRSATINITTAYTTLGSPTRGRADEYGVPGRARGGDVRAGSVYRVGEHRPELFVPKVNGMIVPKVPDLSDLGNVDMSIGPIGPGGPTVIRLVMPDGRLIMETVIDEFHDAEAHL